MGKDENPYDCHIEVAQKIRERVEWSTFERSE
jgi:hypothetical protein